MLPTKHKIIIVDDSKFSLETISLIIQKENQLDLVATFQNPQDALIYLKTHTVDLAIIDLVMPNISGIELTHKITNESLTQVIIISSLIGERIVIDAISAGACDFIQKPFKEEVLITSILKAIENKEMI